MKLTVVVGGMLGFPGPPPVRACKREATLALARAGRTWRIPRDQSVVLFQSPHGSAFYRLVMP